MTVLRRAGLGRRDHAVCVIDDTGTVLERFEVAHDAAGLSDCSAGCAATRRSELRIAIERPSGLWSMCWSRPAIRSCPSTPTRQGQPAALPQPRRQERCLGRLPAGRSAAHRRHRFQSLAAAVRRDPRPACPGAWPRRSGRHAGAAGQPTARPARHVLARRSRNLRRRRLADRLGLHAALSHAAIAAGSAPSAWPRSSRSIPTAAVAALKSCWRGCAQPARPG